VIANVIIIVDLIFLLPTIKGAIYYPSSPKQIATILSLAKLRGGERAVDIGSGDGRIPFALAQAGATAVGYEVNPILVLWSNWQARRLPTSKQPLFTWQNMWTADFSQFEVVTIFGMTYIMKDLEKKLQRELKPGAKVICNSFPFPNWKAEQSIDEVYLYIKK
jgi:cyclopropane fatty-acyl-phospholipid synthase-like methyltransferase